MDTAMLIGERLRGGRERRRADPEPAHRRRRSSRCPRPPRPRSTPPSPPPAAPSTAWSRTTPAERSAALLRIADRIEAEADAFAALEALNCGKPINAVKNDEIPAIVDCWRFFAGAVRCQHGRDRRASTSPATPR